MSVEIVTFEALIASIAKDLGYTPRLAPTWDKTVRITTSAAAIIRPATVVDKEGGERCRLTTELEFVLLKSCLSEPLNSRNVLWNEVKRDAISIIDSILEYHNVLAADDIEIEPMESLVTKSEEVAFLVTATIISNYNPASGAVQIA